MHGKGVFPRIFMLGQSNKVLDAEEPPVVSDEKVRLEYLMERM